MKPLSHQSKSLLRESRAADALPREIRHRALTGLRERIALGAVPPALDVPPPAPLSPGLVPQALSTPLAKATMAIAVVGIPAAVLLWRASSSSEDVPPVRTTASVERAAPPSSALAPPPALVESAPSPAATSGTEVPDKPVTSPGVASRPARSFHAPSTKREQSAAEVTQPAPQQAGAQGIDEEVVLLSRAHAALRAGRPTEALRELAEHRTRFPRSGLAASREATRVVALCAAGRKTEARALAERFLETYPGSTFTSRVKSACAE